MGHPRGGRRSRTLTTDALRNSLWSSAMLLRAVNIAKYQLERLLLRGVYARLLVIALTIGLVSVVGGMTLASIDETEGPRSAIWWAFLRLTDPGYLGDDQGAARRVVSTALTIAGYVLFMGSLVAIMTQWLNERIRTLERGLTPIALRRHLVVVGWTSRTAVIAREMFESVARVRRFLALYEARVLKLVFLVEDLDARIRHDLRRRVGSKWRERDVAMRSGSALDVQDLARADIAHASAILIPADDVGPSEGAADARIVKTLLSVSQHLESTPDDEMPLVVTELFDAHKLSIARRAYGGPLEIVCSDQLVGRLLALTVLNPGLAAVFDELLAHGEGCEVHIVEATELAGETVDAIRRRLPTGIFLGFVSPRERSFEPLLCPPSDQVMAEDDRLVVVAESHEAALPVPASLRADDDEEAIPTTVASPDVSAPERVLVIGWSDRVPDLVIELRQHHGEDLTIDLLSAVPRADREIELDAHEGLGALGHLEGDVTRRAVIARHLTEAYDCIVLMASDWLATGAQSDARTVLCYMLVRDELERRGWDTPVVVELMDASNVALLPDGEGEVVVSPLVIGRVLAHVTLRRELRAVYDDLFDASGPAVRARKAGHYGAAGNTWTFEQLSELTARRGDVLLGLLTPDGPHKVTLNPDKASRWKVDKTTELVVLGTA